MGTGKKVVGELWSWTKTKSGFVFKLVEKFPGAKVVVGALAVGGVLGAAGTASSEEKGAAVDAVVESLDPGMLLFVDVGAATFEAALGPILENMRQEEFEKWKRLNPDGTGEEYRQLQSQRFPEE